MLNWLVYAGLSKAGTGHMFLIQQLKKGIQKTFVSPFLKQDKEGGREKQTVEEKLFALHANAIKALDNMNTATLSDEHIKFDLNNY